MRSRILTFALFVACVAVCSQATIAASWKPRLTISLPSASTALSFSPDGKFIAAGHADGKVSVCETTRGEVVRTLTGHTAEIRAVVFLPSGDRLITLGRDMQALIWSVSDWTQQDRIDDIGFALAISPDGLWLVAQDSKQAVWLWDFKTLKREKQLVKPGVGGARDISFIGNRQVALVYGSNPHLIDITSGEDKLIPVKTSQPQINLEKTGSDQFAISLGKLSDDSAMSHNLSAAGSSLIAVGRGWYGNPAFVDTFDVTNMKTVRRYKPKEGGTETSFSFDGTLLAIAGAKQATIWSLADGKQLAAVKGNGWVKFSPTNLELAVADGSTLVIYSPK
ncbi:MAG: WD40 repeat domain-containing protein [Pyrinomonadaceae bacterium]